MRIQTMHPDKIVKTLGILDTYCTNKKFKENLKNLLIYIQNVAKGNGAKNKTDLKTIVTKVITSCN